MHALVPREQASGCLFCANSPISVVDGCTCLIGERVGCWQEVEVMCACLYG